jgi:CBS domain containing-hemolysin-like protein
LNLEIPEDAGYETLGGFIANAIGRIPPVNTTFENNGVRYTVTEAEPHRINRVRVQITKGASVKTASAKT